MRNRRIKKHEIDTKVSVMHIEETSSNSGHLALKCLFYRCFRVFFLLCDVNMMLREKGDYFHYPKSNDVEIPVEL